MVARGKGWGKMKEVCFALFFGDANILYPACGSGHMNLYLG